MKTQTMNLVRANTIGKFFKGTAMALLISGIAHVSANAATTIPPEGPIKALKTATIKPAGTQDGMVAFEVKFDNILGEKFKVVITDQEGNGLFVDSYSERNFKKTFLIPAPESNRLIIMVRSASGVKREVFEISSSTETVQNFEVKSL